jgi:hypothetical protein
MCPDELIFVSARRQVGLKCRNREVLFRVSLVDAVTTGRQDGSQQETNRFHTTLANGLAPSS